MKIDIQVVLNLLNNFQLIIEVDLLLLNCLKYAIKYATEKNKIRELVSL
jgi:hypothetical protein